MSVLVWFFGVSAALFVVGLGAFFGAPYVPTHRRDVRRFFDEYRPLRDDDVVLDLGSGDGLVLREVARRGARAVGYEINPVLYGVSLVLCRQFAGVRLRLVNAWTTPFPKDVTLVYVFSVAKDGKRLAKKMQKEATRLGRPLTLACYGNPLRGHEPTYSFEAYTVYSFQPLHLPKA